MIQLRTVLNSADNTGAKKLILFHIYGGSKRRTASLGDTIMASVKEALPNAGIKKGEKVRAVVVRVRKAVKRQDGSYIRFDDNAAVLIDNQGVPRGTRIFGPAAKEVREAGFNKVAAMVKELL